MPQLLLVASAMTDPDRGPSSGGTLVLVAAAIVVLAALCLYLLFRRGSIADRARTDMPDAEPERSSDAHDRGDADDRVDTGGDDDVSP